MAQSTDWPASFDKGREVRHHCISTSFREGEHSLSCSPVNYTDIVRNDDSLGASTARTISVELGDSKAEALWLALTPSLIYATFCFVLSRLSTVFGRRNTVMVSFALFTMFSVTCGSARTFRSLVASQIGQAVGGTGLYCMAMIVMPDVTPVALIPFLPAVMGGTAIFGSLLGPVAGGMLAESGHWRWSVFLCFLTSILYLQRLTAFPQVLLDQCSYRCFCRCPLRRSLSRTHTLGKARRAEAQRS